jgi:hypothetical protein
MITLIRQTDDHPPDPQPSARELVPTHGSESHTGDGSADRNALTVYFDYIDPARLLQLKLSVHLSHEILHQ